MTLTAGEVESYLDLNLGGPIPPGVALINLINQAGRWLTNIHPWKWLQARPMHLDFRAKVTLSGGALSADGLTYTETGAFADYDRVVGDKAELTDGSGGAGTLVPGFYEILAKTDNTLTFRTSAATGGAVNVVNGEIDTNTVALPSDFKSIVPVSSIADSNNTIYGLTFTTAEYLNYLRTNAVGGATFGNYWGCLGRAGPTPAPANEPVTWILEITPTPNANERDALQGFYNAKWTQVVDAQQILFLPDEGESFFLTLCETFAKGRLEGDAKSLTERLRELRGDPNRRIPVDPDLEAFMRWDGAVQQSYGLMRGGGPQRAHLGTHSSVPARFTVNDPS